MKAKLLFLCLCFSMVSRGQNIQIDQITPTAVAGGVNVNLLVTTFNGAGYLSNTHTVTGNTITLNVCYWYNLTLPVFQLSNDFFIPLTNSGNYTIQVNIFHSASATQCDFSATGPSASTTFLSHSSVEITDKKELLYPNPTRGIVYFQGTVHDLKQVTVYDTTGKLVGQFFNSNLDFSSFDDGMYIVKIETIDQVMTQKLLVRK